MADGHYEYIVRQKSEGGLLQKKLLLIFCYILLPVVCFVVAASLFYGTPIIVPACVLIIGIEVLVIFFSWRFTRVEFESSIQQNMLIITTVTAGLRRRVSLEKDIKSFSEIGLFTVEASNALEKMRLNKDYVFISSLDSENIYYGIFTEGEESCVVYFETSPEAFSHIKKINSMAVRRAQITAKGEQST